VLRELGFTFDQHDLPLRRKGRRQRHAGDSPADHQHVGVGGRGLHDARPIVRVPVSSSATASANTETDLAVFIISMPVTHDAIARRDSSTRCPKSSRHTGQPNPAHSMFQTIIHY